MICKHCNAEFEGEFPLCPFCGKSLNGEDAPKPKKKIWPIVLGIIGAVLAMGVLTVVLLIALGVDMKPPANDILCKDCYTAEAEKVAKKSDVVVAKIGDRELTNSQLQVYYRMQIQSFLTENSAYLSYYKLDLSKPLSEQTCYGDETKTWEQYFLETALLTWQNQQAMVLLAEENAFDTSSHEDELAKLPELMQQQAEQGGYDDTQAMLREVFGESCDLEDYSYYLRLLTLGGAFYETKVQEMSPTDEEMEAFYTENLAAFEESGITKESGLNSTVRHILIEPESIATDDAADATDATDPTADTQTEQAAELDWDGCLAKAESILNEWKNGEATEEKFAELANTHSADGGSNTTGGLYSNVNVNAGFVEPFTAWATDSERKTGDTGIVKTEFGYHIMYFVSGESYWKQTASNTLLSERLSDMLKEAVEKWPMEVEYKKIVMEELNWD